VAIGFRMRPRREGAPEGRSTWPTPAIAGGHTHTRTPTCPKIDVYQPAIFSLRAGIVRNYAVLFCFSAWLPVIGSPTKHEMFEKGRQVEFSTPRKKPQDGPRRDDSCSHLSPSASSVTSKTLSMLHSSGGLASEATLNHAEVA
jgi:hypothetical protein